MRRATRRVARLAGGAAAPRSRRAGTSGCFLELVAPATKWIAVATALALLTTSPALAAGQPQPRASLPDIEDEVMCIVCGVPLELATEAGQANQERDFIRKLIAEGKTKDQIKDALVAQYGENVLAVPGDSGFDLAAWLVPALGIVIAAVTIGVGVRRWRRDGTGTGGGEGGSAEPPDKKPEGEDAERLEQDLARYEL
jgi:cytochrome c-type biogenesis protein CcmH